MVLVAFPQLVFLYHFFDMHKEGWYKEKLMQRIVLFNN